jgi:probable phosphoglycerate mutase
MPIILLIRHGENDFVKKQKLAGRLSGVHLNERGRTQAQAIAQAMKDVPIKAIYSSPLDRAMETAEPLAKVHGLKVESRKNLIETALGDWEGKSIKQLNRDKRWRILQENPSRAKFPGGETMPEQQTRLVDEIEILCEKHKAKDVIAVVGHADPIKLIIAYFIGLPLDLFQRLGLDTGSISTLWISEKSAKLMQLNAAPKDFSFTPV